MKRASLIMYLVLISISLLNCSKSESEAQVVQGMNLEGTWGIIALAYINQGVTQNVYVNEIKNGQAVNDFFFMKDGKFKQTSDMSGTGKMETYEGNWKITGNTIIINLLINVIQAAVFYTWEHKNDLLILTRTSPDYSMNIVITFRRK